MLNTRPSTHSGTHSGDSSATRCRNTSRLSSRNRINAFRPSPSRIWCWLPSTAMSSTLATTGAAGSRRSCASANRSMANRMSSSASTALAPGNAIPSSAVSRSGRSPLASHSPIRRGIWAACTRGPTTSGVRKFCWTNSPRLSPIWSFLRGMIAVCGIGRPSGCRNRAVTANQSASPPTIAASLAACRNGQMPWPSPTSRHSTKTTAASTSPPVATSFIRISAARLARSPATSAASAGPPVLVLGHVSRPARAIAAASRSAASVGVTEEQRRFGQLGLDQHRPVRLGSRSIRA